MVVASRPAQWLAGGSAWWRVGGRTRVGGLAAGGVMGGQLAGRVEASGHFLLDPRALRGFGMYAGGGAALVLGEGTEGRLQLVAGVEQRPGGTSGWVVEVGLGGGVRIAAGWRWRFRAVPPRRP